MSIDPSAFGYDPFQGTSYFNPTGLQAYNQSASTAAQTAYYQAQAQNQSDQLAFQQAQAAYANALSLGSQYGYAPGGGPYTNLASVPQPPAGTPTLSAGQMVGSIGYVPGYTGVDASQTLQMLQAQQSMAQGAAGMTGFYNAPAQSQYTPGSFLRIDPSTYDYATNGDQLDYVLPSGQIQRVTLPQAKAMGWNGNLGQLSTIPFSTAATLESGPPTKLPQQTLQGLQAYQQMNTAAQQQALAASQATGMYTAPGQILAPGTNSQGGKFSDLDQGTQMAYYYSNGGDWQAAMNKWVADSNAAVQQAYSQGGGQGTAPGVTTPGTPQETMAAQQQYFTQAQNLASQYGNYYSPLAPGQTAQAGVNAPQAGQETLAAQNQYFTQAQNLTNQFGQYYSPIAPGQTAQAGVNAPQAGQQTLANLQWQQQSAMQYLQLLSQLQGPQDYGQYLKTLGSTPAGIQGLVGAAAGQYLPGGGATGVQPQAQSLQNLIGSATGYGSYGGYGPTGTGTGAATSTANQLNAAATGGGGAGTGANAAGGTGGTASPGGMNYQDFMAAAQGLPPPSQIAPQSFNQMLPSQQQMLGSMYGNLGYAPGDINKMYQLSLPKYAAGSAAGTTRLV